MDILQALILGIVQGATEFLPVPVQGTWYWYRGCWAGIHRTSSSTPHCISARLSRLSSFSIATCWKSLWHGCAVWHNAK